MKRALPLLPALFLCLFAGAAQAQAPLVPEEPATPARVQMGPLSLRPSLIIRDLGYDSNVRFLPAGAEGDFTATVGARADLGFNSPRVRATYSSIFEYLWFQSLDDERGTNRGAEGRVDVRLERIRPYFTAGIVRSHERLTPEIDTRALRVASNLSAGTTVAAFSRTLLHVGYRRSATRFADEEQFRGINLATELNGTSQAILYGADFVLSPFTTVSLFGERGEDRFDVSSDRDANSFRYGVSATLHPLALVSGRASIGVRAFRPLSTELRQFTGLTAAIAANYAIQDDTRFGLILDRDLRYSIAEETPYYVLTGSRLTVTQRLYGAFDGQLFGGFDRIAYRARLTRLDLPDETDVVRIVGGGIGYNVADGSRVGVTIDFANRTSPVDAREYSRGRVYATWNYGL